MSAYLGFQPTKNSCYFFVSYNSEDAERVGAIAKTMSYSGISLWYDHGIEYGEQWETVITERIQNAEAILLFFTKGILQKTNSYVQKEYRMATQFFDKKVFVVMLDEIGKTDVPTEKVAWWLDINERQCICGYQYADVPHLVEEVAKSLGVESHEDRMNKIIERYNELYHEGRLSEAEDCLSEYLHGVSLQGKVRLFANIAEGKLEHTTLVSPAEALKEDLEEPLYTHMKEPKYRFYDCKRLRIRDDVFTVANEYLFHRGDKGDAHIIWIWKNGELIHTVGGQVEASNLQVFWDSRDDIIYVTFESEKEIFEEHQYIESKLLRSVVTVENPGGQVVCTNFIHME